MFSFPLVLFGENLFEPTGLLFCGGRIDERWVMKDHEFFATAVATKSAHLFKAGLTIPDLPFLDGYGLHARIPSERGPYRMSFVI